MSTTWALFDGIEIINNARTQKYVENSGVNIRVNCDDCCDVLNRNPYDLQEELTYVSPAADPAPWYDPDLPESAEFLGFLLSKTFGLDSALEREITPKSTGRGGGFLNKLNAKAREIKFSGVIMATSSCGADYGLRWLTKVLSGQFACDGCSLSDLELRFCCPTEQDYVDHATDGRELGRFVFKKVGLLNSPKYESEDLSGCDTWRPVAFILASEEPYIYKNPETCLDTQPFDYPLPPSGDCFPICDWLYDQYALCCDLEATAVDEMTSVITINISDEQDSTFEFILTENTTCSGGDTCEPTPTNDLSPVFRFSLVDLPRSSILTIDSSLQEIYVQLPDGVTEDGFKYLYLPEDVTLADDVRFGWLNSRCAINSCLKVQAGLCGTGYNTTVTIDRIERRL